MEGDHNNDIGLIEGGSVLIRDGLIEQPVKPGILRNWPAD